MEYKATILTLGEKIKKSTNILLINHIRMDPDAFGSLGGFYLLLKKLGKNVVAINDELPPENFLFLIESPIIETAFEIKGFNPELIISFDAASIEQLGKIYSENKDLFHATDFFVIDHHLTNPGFGSHNIIDVDISSSCELTYEIIKTLGLADLIDENIATLLLAGILSDTSTYYNKNTSAQTLRNAADLMEKGGRSKQVMFELFRKKSFEKVKLWGKVFSGLTSIADGRIVGVSVKKEMYRDFAVKDQGLKGLMNEFIANIENCEIGYMLYELDSGEIKASMRSNRDDIDVARICENFGGGGHKLAAGFTYKGNIDEVQRKLIPLLEKALAI